MDRSLSERSQSVPLERPRLARTLSRRAMSPTIRVKERFGLHIASALGERSAVRMTQRLTVDGGQRVGRGRVEGG